MPGKTRYAVDCEVQAVASDSAALDHEAMLEQVELQLRDCEAPELEQRLLDRRKRILEGRDAERGAARYLREKADSALAVVGAVSTSHGEVAELDGALANRRIGKIRHPDQVALDASSDRKRLLLGQQIEDSVALGLDVAASAGAGTSIELMLSHQIAALHRAGMQALEDAVNQADCDYRARLSNTAARLMTAFQSAALTLQRLQQGVRQDVHVRHVHVHEGAQAVIGNVDGRGPRKRAGGG